MNGKAIGVAAVALGLLAGGGWLIAGRDRAGTGGRQDAGVKVVHASGDAPARLAAAQTLPASAPSAAPAASPVPASGAAPVDPGDADIAAMLPDPADAPDRLYALVRSETRDRNWAQQAETALRDELVGVPHRENTRIRCAATLCEVSGRFAQGLTGEQINVPMQAMQGPVLHDALARRGLGYRSAMFGSKDGQNTFVTYWRRRT